jgi:hypothetical protein
MKENLNIRLDESNELLFEIDVEGTLSRPSDIRFVISAAADLSYMIKGRIDEQGRIRVVVPPLEGKIKEGLHDSTLEILIDGKYFTPIEFSTQFKKSVNVVVEQKKNMPKINIGVKVLSIKNIKNENL